MSRPKTSEWLKQVGCQTPPSSSAGGDARLSDSALVSSTGSERKKRGKLGFKVVTGGLAEQLQCLMQRESAELSFWQHKNRRSKEAELCEWQGKREREREKREKSSLLSNGLSMVPCLLLDLFIRACG